MAQYRIPDPEELLECPYDNVHMVRAKRFQYHLMKCRTNYTGRDYATCPFNAKHEMPRPELRHHLTTCPDKAMLEPELSHAARKKHGDGVLFKGCTDMPPSNNFVIPSSENWDHEITDEVRSGVDPSFYSRVKFKDLSGMKKSEKKMMRDTSLTLEEKMRNLMKSTNKAAVKTEVTGPDQLRMPMTTSAAMPDPPRMRKRPQPNSSVFAYSIAHGMPCAVLVPSPPGSRVDADGFGAWSLSSVGVGRGVIPPPPGLFNDKPGGLGGYQGCEEDDGADWDPSFGENPCLIHQFCAPEHLVTISTYVVDQQFHGGRLGVVVCLWACTLASAVGAAKKKS